MIIWLESVWKFYWAPSEGEGKTEGDEREMMEKKKKKNKKLG